jgi:threonine dehydratase
VIADPDLAPEAIRAARERIDPVFIGSPQYVHEGLSARLGVPVIVKVETVNPIRSFKGRGTWVVVAAMAGEGTIGPERAIVCASAGNFGQGVAYGARAAGLGSVVYAARDANPAKLARMRALGADVRLVDGDFDAAKEAVEPASQREGLRLVVDGREPDIALGAGTIAYEMTAHGRPLDAVVVPVGNGSLAWGMSTWLAAASPDTQVIAVSPHGAPMMEHAWRTGELVSWGPTDTIAEGLAARVPVPEAVEGIRAAVDRYLLLDDAAFLDAMRLLAEHAGVLSEPAGAAALAGAIALGDEQAGATVGIPVGGSNVPDGLLGRVVA